jgi:hypothetical protein
MNLPEDLKTVEKKAFLSHFEDGLLEIAVGLMFAAVGITDLLFYIAIPVHWVFLVVAPGILVFLFGKTAIYPRRGVAKFSVSPPEGYFFPFRISKQRMLMALCVIVPTVLAVCLLLDLQRGILRGDNIFPISNIKRLGYGLGYFTIPYGMVAWILRNPRFLIPAVPGFAGALTYDFIPSPLNGLLAFGLAGVLLVVSGLIVPSKFMDRYPKMSEGEDHG